jgi:uncharacterized protein YjbJ (UPF0337 family)
MATGKTRDKAVGKAAKVRGRIKDAAGALTGNRSKQTRGGMEQAYGEAKEKKGRLKDKLD